MRLFCDGCSQATWPRSMRCCCHVLQRRKAVDFEFRLSSTYSTACLTVELSVLLSWGGCSLWAFRGLLVGLQLLRAGYEVFVIKRGVCLCYCLCALLSFVCSFFTNAMNKVQKREKEKKKLWGHPIFNGYSQCTRLKWYFSCRHWLRLLTESQKHHHILLFWTT